MRALDLDCGKRVCSDAFGQDSHARSWVKAFGNLRLVPMQPLVLVFTSLLCLSGGAVHFITLTSAGFRHCFRNHTEPMKQHRPHYITHQVNSRSACQSITVIFLSFINSNKSKLRSHSGLPLFLSSAPQSPETFATRA